MGGDVAAIASAKARAGNRSGDAAAARPFLLDSDDDESDEP